MQIFILPTNTCFWIATPISDIGWYNKIYEIKNRDLDKPLALLIDSFEYLEENTILNKEQIDFLKAYEKPFTILSETKEDVIPKSITNKKIYKKVAFRVAHNFMQAKLIRLNWPLFLTSANKSNKNEIFTSLVVREKFKTEIEKYDINVFAHGDFCINSNQSSSDIFEFTWDGLDIKYLRKQ